MHILIFAINFFKYESKQLVGYNTNNPLLFWDEISAKKRHEK